MSAHAPWSASLCEKPGHVYTFKQVRSLDVDSVRLCDGFEYRYHRGGAVSFVSLRTSEELPVTMLEGLPEGNWWHRAGCGCPACRGGPWKDAGANDALRSLSPPC
jgi:hypothetical protein